MRRLSHALVLAAATAAIALAAAGSASAKTVWLCSPQQATDPCDYGLTTTVIAPDDSRSTETPKPANRLRSSRALTLCNFSHSTSARQVGTSSRQETNRASGTTAS